MSKPHDYIDMVLRSAESFVKDGKIDANELDEIIKIAERDGVIDTNEIRVLHRIISKIDPSEVNRAMRDKLNELAEKLDKASKKKGN